MSNATLGITSNGVKEGSLDHFIDVLCELTGRTDKDALADECFEANGKRGVRIDMSYLPKLWREALKIADRRTAQIADTERRLRIAVEALEWIEANVEKGASLMSARAYRTLAQIRGEEEVKG